MDPLGKFNDPFKFQVTSGLKRIQGCRIETRLALIGLLRSGKNKLIGKSLETMHFPVKFLQIHPIFLYSTFLNTIVLQAIFKNTGK